jgi:hypothetical protein
MDQPGFTPDSVREISFAVEPNGYDMDIVDGLLVDIANVLHEGVVPADLIPIDPAVQLPTRWTGSWPSCAVTAPLVLGRRSRPFRFWPARRS